MFEDNNGMGGLVPSLLEKALQDAADKLTKKIPGPRLAFSSQRYCRAFKELWIYSNDHPPVSNFEEVDGSFVILLHKNLGVTNASLFELFGLIRKLSKPRNRSQTQSFEFLSDADYTSIFERLWEPFTPDPSLQGELLDTHLKKSIKEFCKSYRALFETTFVADVYFTTVVLHVPRCLKLNLRALAFEAGYVHSVGAALLVRSIDRVEENELTERLSAFLNAAQEKCIFFTPYADEFFKPYEADSPTSIRNGLDGIRLQLRKHFVGSSHFSVFLKVLRDHFGNKLFVPQGFEDYKSERKRSIKQGASKNFSIWAFTDARVVFSTDDGEPIRSRELILIFYAQIFSNENQFILFKERKPGWYASITLPHTLSIACVNIVRRHLPDEGRPVILDPFCGSGTTLIDVALRVPNAIVVGIDRERVVDQVVRDNLEFFSSDDGRIEEYQLAYSSIITELGRRKETTKVDARGVLAELDAGTRDHRTYLRRFETAWAVVGNEVLGDESHGKVSIESDHIAKLSGRGLSSKFHHRLRSPYLDLLDRILIYTILRALSLGTFNLRGDETAELGVIVAEMKKTQIEYEYLCKSLKGLREVGGDVFLEQAGDYSRSGVVSPWALRRALSTLSSKTVTQLKKKGAVLGWRPGIHVVHAKDSVPLVRSLEGQVDAIITDPPYGFNVTEDNPEGYRELYRDMVKPFVKALKPGGQLMLVLPSFATNGRTIPFFETRASLTRQIIAAGDELGLRFKNPVETFPGDQRLYRFPLYWRSASVLERNVIRFIRD